MAGFEELTKGFKKSFGDGVGGKGVKYVDVERIPTGFFPFDLASGGGLPRGRTIEVFGPESSGKTNLLLKAIANHQRLWPDKKNALFNLEGTFDAEWATRLGVNVDDLYVFEPDYAEQMVDMIEGLLASEECGIVGVDSIAAMVTTRELGQSAEKSDTGGAGLAVGKLIRKSTQAMNNARKAGNWPTLVLINQIRMKIGVMYGDPETTPGGNAPKFAAAMRIRTYGKNIMDNKVSKTLPVRKHTSIVIKKWKVPIVATHADWEMATVPHDGLVVGEVADWGLIDKYMREYDLLAKGEKGKWVMCGEDYPTLTACKEKFLGDKDFNAAVRKAIIDQVLADTVNDPSKGPQGTNEADGEQEGDDL